MKGFFNILFTLLLTFLPFTTAFANEPVLDPDDNLIVIYADSSSTSEFTIDQRTQEYIQILQDIQHTPEVKGNQYVEIRDKGDVAKSKADHLESYLRNLEGTSITPIAIEEVAGLPLLLQEAEIQVMEAHKRVLPTLSDDAAHTYNQWIEEIATPMDKESGALAELQQHTIEYQQTAIQYWDMAFKYMDTLQTYIIQIVDEENGLIYTIPLDGGELKVKDLHSKNEESRENNENGWSIFGSLAVLLSSGYIRRGISHIKEKFTNPIVFAKDLTGTVDGIRDIKEWHAREKRRYRIYENRNPKKKSRARQGRKPSNKYLKLKKYEPYIEPILKQETNTKAFKFLKPIARVAAKPLEIFSLGNDITTAIKTDNPQTRKKAIVKSVWGGAMMITGGIVPVGTAISLVVGPIGDIVIDSAMPDK